VAKHLAEVFDHVGILIDGPRRQSRVALRLVIQRYLLRNQRRLKVSKL